MPSTTTSAQPFDADVAIVGFGPVGQALAALLGHAGHRVVAFERFDEIYRLPRAVHVDHEIMRMLQKLQVTDGLADDFVPFRDYHWFGADGEPLMTLQAPVPAASGWEPDYLFFQPILEHALDARARSASTVTVERGWAATGLTTDDDGAELVVSRVADPADTRTVRARWVVGADGANSFVREARHIPRRDLGFQERWLVVDVQPHDMDALDLPTACQWCDPERPTTHVQSGAGHRRWEFMLLADEEPSDFEDPEAAWALLAPWFTPADGTLTRHAVYEFRSMLADRMRDGRVLLIGDAAHLTPPFLGQGLCSGLRDALNVAWKLDLVLRGQAGETLLDTVDPERQPQNEWIIAFAVELGKVLCQLDPVQAAERDTMLRSVDAPPPIGLPPLEQGVVHRDSAGTPGTLAGTLAVQGRVAGPAGAGLLDDIVGDGFVLLSASGGPLAALDDGTRAWWEAIGGRSASLDGDVRDEDGRLTAWLAEHDVHAVLVRPDFYVFGSAATPADVPALLDDLREQLGVV